jgi:hypothetical protein
VPTQADRSRTARFWRTATRLELWRFGFSRLHLARSITAGADSARAAEPPGAGRPLAPAESRDAEYFATGALIDGLFPDSPRLALGGPEPGLDPRVSSGPRSSGA